MSKPTPEEHRAAVRKYREHTKFVRLQLHTGKDADIIARIAQEPSIQGYIKQCIRNEIEREESRNKSDDDDAGRSQSRSCGSD